MKRITVRAILVSIMIAQIVTVAILWNRPVEYKCPYCGLVKNQSMKGAWACPNDSYLMEPTTSKENEQQIAGAK